MSAPEPGSAGRFAFITGAASGIGRETARFFLKQGWFVGAFDIDEAGLLRLRQEMAEGAGCVGRLDVSDATAFSEAMAQFAVHSGGRLDLLFNNAGIARGGPIEHMRAKDIALLLNVNVVGVVNGVRSAAPLLKATPNSLCFSMSSATGVFGLPGMAIYSATKHAIKGLTEALSAEFKPFGVRVADALPGLVDTPFIPASAAEHHGTSAMFRVVAPSDVAEVVWQAYHHDRLHWYVPEDLRELAASAARDPQAVRDQVVAQSGPFDWMRTALG